jgi:hypothetical protein
MHIKISVIFTFISDLVLLALMLSGILRWKGPRQINGTWWLLYKQVGLPSFHGHFDVVVHVDY